MKQIILTIGDSLAALGCICMCAFTWRGAWITWKHVLRPMRRRGLQAKQILFQYKGWRISFSRPGFLFHRCPVINHPSLFPSMSKRFNSDPKTRPLIRRHPSWPLRLAAPHRVSPTEHFIRGIAVTLWPWHIALSIATCALSGLWARLNYLIWHEKCNWLIYGLRSLFSLFYWNSCYWIGCIYPYYWILHCTGTYRYLYMFQCITDMGFFLAALFPGSFITRNLFTWLIKFLVNCCVSTAIKD